jgi:4-carboxymuconolactone decarboxylase
VPALMNICSPISRLDSPFAVRVTTSSSVGVRLIGDFAPKLVGLTDDVLFGDVWERPGLSKRDRSLVTVAALVALNRTEQLPGHLRRAIDNGVTQDELKEAITHLAFYSGWPTAMGAIVAAKKLFEPNAQANPS